MNRDDAERVARAELARREREEHEKRSLSPLLRMADGYRTNTQRREDRRQEEEETR